MRLLSHLRELSLAMEDWERYRRIPREKIEKDRDSRNMVFHAMLVAIQSAIDIATDIIAEKGLRRPETYRETFEILAEDGIIDALLAKDLSDLAGFRNVIVHIYWDLDLAQVYEILQSDYDVLMDFFEEMKRYAQNNEHIQ